MIHISIRFDDPTIKPLPVTDKAIGIDLGISSLVITSDGDKVLIVKEDILHKAESRYGKEPWTITTVHTNGTI